MGEKVNRAEPGHSDKAPTSACGQGTEPPEDGFPPPRLSEKSFWGVRRELVSRCFPRPGDPPASSGIIFSVA